MNNKDNGLRAQLIEAMLEYIDGKGTLQSVLALGNSFQDKSHEKKTATEEVISQLHHMDKCINGGKDYSYIEIRETFTTMLQKLTSE